MSAVDRYLDAVCEHIRFREVHADVRQELNDHIADAVAAHQEAGLSDADALAQALAQMGAPDVVGEQLDRAHRPQTDWMLVGATSLFVLLGLWAVYAVDVSDTGGISGFFSRKVLYSLAGAGAAAGLFFSDYRRLTWLAWPLWILTLTGMGLAFVTQSRVNGFIPYINATPLLLLVALAGIFAAWKWSSWWDVAKAAAVLLGPCLLYLAMGELFAVVEYGVGFWIVLLVSKPGWRKAGALGLINIGLMVGLLLRVLKQPYWVDRLQVWFDAGLDPQGAGYQVVQSVKAIRDAGWWGQGATAPLETLPAHSSDFLFSYLVYTLGWVAGAATVLLGLFMVLRLWRDGSHVHDRFGRYLMVTVLTSFTLQFAWNVLMTVGALPVVGVEMPLVSSGARQALFLSVVGLALGVYRRRSLISRKRFGPS